jgi:hypothetical protein
MYRVTFKLSTKPLTSSNTAAAAVPAATAASSEPVVADLGLDIKMVFEDYADNDFLKCLTQTHDAIKAGDIGSMLLLGILHIEGGIAGDVLPPTIQNLDKGIQLLTDVILISGKKDQYKSLAQIAAFKLYELYAGKLQNQSKLDPKQAKICLEIAALLGHTDAGNLIQQQKQLRI